MHRLPQNVRLVAREIPKRDNKSLDQREKKEKVMLFSLNSTTSGLEGGRGHKPEKA